MCDFTEDYYTQDNFLLLISFSFLLHFFCCKSTRTFPGEDKIMLMMTKESVE